MEFLAYSILFLTVLFFSTLGLVEVAFITCRAWSRLSYLWRSRLRFWRSARGVRALKRRYERTQARHEKLGSLRVTRTRKEQFGDGPPETR